ncbi:MAG: ferredoxin [Verrucomicrobia bacterium A1]|nr:MAG: ferredoxin [Verrucomicrobia bacterium A1]
MADEATFLARREFLRRGLAGAAGLCAAAAAAGAMRGAVSQAATVWQIDPTLCVQCGQCMTHCVLAPSAVKCVHTYAMCGYCKLCFGFFQPGAAALTTAAENQMCPTGAIRRTFIEAPYYEYTIDEKLCTGCGKCVKGCNTFGNGSLHLQILRDLCVNCNECAIARACPADAIARVPVEQAYRMKSSHAPAAAPAAGPPADA